MNKKMNIKQNLFASIVDYYDGIEKGTVTPDATKVNKFAKSIQAFVMAPKITGKVIQAQKQGVAVSTDFAQLVSDSFNMVNNLEYFDLGWERAFRQAPVPSNQDKWDVYDVTNTVQVVQIEEGQRVDVGGMAGSTDTARVKKYGGAIGWTDELIRFRKIARMIELAELFRNAYWLTKTDIHYALIAAAASVNITATLGTVADGVLVRNALTINEAILDLEEANLNKGQEPNPPILLYAHKRDEAMIESVFKAAENAGVASAAGNRTLLLSRNITRIYSWNQFMTQGFPFVCIGGRKAQKADVLQPTIFNQEQDILTLNKVQAVWAYYGAYIGDTDQFNTITLA